MKIAAIVLAAGKSSRMGFNKLLADVGDKPLIVRTIDNIAGSKADPIIVVTGHDGDRVRQALAACKVQFVHNGEFASGLASSLKAGLSLAQGYDGALICLGDMPLVSASVINSMIDAFVTSDRKSLVLPVHAGVIGNPVLWGASYFPALLALEGDRGARQLIERDRALAVEVPVEDIGVHLDADTPEALAGLKSIAGF